MAARLFPEPWQRAMREHAARALGSVPANSYLGTGLALVRWAILDRLDRLKSRVLLIAAEKDFTPLAEKRDLARKLNAELVVVRGSPTHAQALSLDGSIAEEHALSPLLLD